MHKYLLQSEFCVFETPRPFLAYLILQYFFEEKTVLRCEAIL